MSIVFFDIDLGYEILCFKIELNNLFLLLLLKGGYNSIKKNNFINVIIIIVLE